MRKEKTNKRTKKGKWGFTILTILCLALALFSMFQIVKQLKDYSQSNQLYADLGTEYVTIPEDTNSEASNSETEEVQTEKDEEGTEAERREEEADVPLIQVDFASLKEQNPDIVGWIYFENEDLSYPILYSGDNSTYLHTASDGSYATAGSIFEEGACSPDLNDAYTIIYGHNMRNLSMFGKLKYYYRQDDYYQDHSYFQIATEEGTWRYQIFAYEVIDTSNFVYTTGFGHDEAFASFIRKIKSQSMIHPDIEVTEESTIVTLSTCTTGDGRFVVHGVRME